MTAPAFKKKVLPQVIAAILAAAASPHILAADESNAPASDGKQALDSVEVRGVRATLTKSLVEKRQAQNIVDSINAEDVGKFPDKNVADSLQRVPGISVDRSWGEGRDIFVRGTDKSLNMTQLNGQSVASAYWWKNDKQSRGFNYDVLPSEIIGSLDVYKSPSADLDEGSIGGLVNVKTRKPLSFKDQLTAQASVEATYSKLPGKTDPQLNGLLNWKSDDKTFGALLSLSKQTRTMRRDGLENFVCGCTTTIVDQTTGAQTPNAYVAWGGGSAIFRQDRERTTTNLALQFRPNKQTDLSLNYLNSDMSMNNSNQNYLWMGAGLDDIPQAGKISVLNPKFITTSDGGKALVGGTLGPAAVAFEPIFRESYIHSKVLDVEGNYTLDRWKLHGQIGSTQADGGSAHDRNMPFAGNSRVSINLGPDTYEWKYLDINPLDPKALNLTLSSPLGGARDWVRKMQSKESYAQADLNYNVDGGFITDVKVGVKLRDNTVQNNRVIGSFDTSKATWQPFSLADVSSGASPLLSQAAATSGALTQYAWVDDAMAQKVFDMYDKGMVYKEKTSEYYKINEKIFGMYAKADYATGALRGDFGVRLVRTKQTSEAYQGEAGKPGYGIGSVSRTYNDVLPSVNGVYELNREVVLRGAVSRVMARNTYSDLSSTVEINGTGNSATAGNPLLKPVHANQAELGIEWYFAEASLLSATAFIKRLDTSVTTDTRTENVGGVLLQVKRPYNLDSGPRINGLELQWQQSFGNSGFGSVVNYTLTDAVQGAGSNGQRLKVEGNSRNQLNAAVYYEKSGVALRLSYNYRDKSYGGQQDGGQIVNSAYGQWDATANWDITPKLALYGSAVNITNAVVKQNTSDGLPIGVYENGPRYSVGLRAKF
ncbi:TonB-dependent receptor [Paucibacter sp. APW11]|uniref:TonB-dependent receptor n=1 Tax=Roseateles aquae TaxID=3077235 RepID=A0ABU3PFQ7_9BURK|nr:TonB-dependent receptor [Paucibacter sp. APW11]MDT9001427.1 TonB-dependent receptor [Paucibacter sp. APW11]